MSLQDNPSVPVEDEKLQLEIISQLWHQTTPNSTDPSDLDWAPYMLYYNTQCNTAIQTNKGKYTTIRKHVDIQSVAQHMHASTPKAAIKFHIQPSMRGSRTAEEADIMLEGSVMLVARLLSMTDIGPLPYTRRGTHHSLTWTCPTSSLQDLLRSHFVPQDPASYEQDSSDMLFDEHFTAYKLYRYCGVEISWTSNLADHLHLSRGGKQLYIFHHASFLQWQDGVLPDGLAAETLDTLALLFPANDAKTRDWVTHAPPLAGVDMRILELGRLRDCRGSDFRYWRKRLGALERVFEAPHRGSIAQQWRDRRDKAQWYTFWVAMVILCLTVFFGVVQSVEGALQVYKAYHPT
ncbi:hypothetical protein PSV08DRAFT_220239 [Bipolaris maydis]|nr:hypothetical protein J3E73DRAFT_385959 [Bipolaris maydis]KAJ6271860.1 hypothetical protein PSV08DRAFT_220239 [Bipolaris maydis]